MKKRLGHKLLGMLPFEIVHEDDDESSSEQQKTDASETPSEPSSQDQSSPSPSEPTQPQHNQAVENREPPKPPSHHAPAPEMPRIPEEMENSGYRAPAHPNQPPRMPPPPRPNTRPQSDSSQPDPRGKSLVRTPRKPTDQHSHLIPSQSGKRQRRRATQTPRVNLLDNPEYKEMLQEFTGNVLTNANCPEQIRISKPSSTPQTPEYCAFLDNGWLIYDQKNGQHEFTQIQYLINGSSTSTPVTLLIGATITDIAKINSTYEQRVGLTKKKKTNTSENELAGSQSRTTAFKYIRELEELGASDIHIEMEDPAPGQTEGFTYIWGRINSMLIRHDTIKNEEGLGVLAVLKAALTNSTTGNYDPVTCKDQGSIEHTEKNRDVLSQSIKALRAQFRPIGNSGGALVMRINSADEKLDLPIEKIGMSPFQMRLVKKTLNTPSGVLYVTGPTGSGKSIAARSFFQYIGSQYNNEARIGLMAIEDPSEYPFKYHISSTSLSGSETEEIHEKKYREMVKIMMRSNPDKIILGEGRDKGTVISTFQIAETGHFILSTLHVDNPHDIYNRVLGMDVPDFYVYSTALKCVTAHRLITRLCPNCALSYKSENAQNIIQSRHKNQINHAFRHTNISKHFRIANPNGCASCTKKGSKNKGEKGRSPVIEILCPDETYTSLRIQGKRKEAIEHWKKELSGTSFQEHAIYKMLKGDISPIIVLQFIGPFEKNLLLPDNYEKMPEDEQRQAFRNRLDTLIQLHSDGLETLESIENADPLPYGQAVDYPIDTKKDALI